MQRFPLLMAVAVLLGACGLEEAGDAAGNGEASEGTLVATIPAVDITAEIARSRAAIQAFAGTLQSELAKAMKAGGPVAAIGICNTEAMLIAAKVSGEQSLNLARVSLKNRNPVNYPNDWQAEVLVDFDQRAAAGEAPEELEWADVVEAGDRLEFRYMKAIPTRPFCLQCHGPELAPEVREILAELYPEDLAIGFREGEIRGAFVARGVLDQ